MMLTQAQWKLLREKTPIAEASRRHGRTPTPGMLTEEKRYQIVDEYFSDTGKTFKGLPLKGSVRRIALFHGCDRNTVRRWIETFCESNKVDDKKRTGRPATTGTAAVVDFVKARLDQNDPAMRESPIHSKKQLQAEIKQQLRVTVSMRTLTTVLRKADAVSKSTVREAGMTEEQKEERLAFAKAYVDKPVQWWLECAFGDGTPCVHTSQKRQLVLRGQEGSASPKVRQ
jgi:hypothetical protein